VVVVVVFSALTVPPRAVEFSAMAVPPSPEVTETAVVSVVEVVALLSESGTTAREYSEVASRLLALACERRATAGEPKYASVPSRFERWRYGQRGKHNNHHHRDSTNSRPSHSDPYHGH